MLFVFDTSSFRIMAHFFPERFPSFWEQMNELVRVKSVISVREVFNELSVQLSKRPMMEKWVKENKKISEVASQEEAEFVRKIFGVPKFLELVRNKQLLRGTPVADPFVVAAAKIREGCVVTEESERPNSAQIPNVCMHFGVECITFEDFMARVGWRY